MEGPHKAVWESQVRTVWAITANVCCSNQSTRNPQTPCESGAGQAMERDESHHAGNHMRERSQRPS